MKLKFLKILLTNILLLAAVFSPTRAQNGEVIQIPGLERLGWSLVTTIQFYSLVLVAIAFVVLGVKYLISGDDSHSKSDLKSTAVRIIIGEFIILSATTFAQVLKNFLS